MTKRNYVDLKAIRGAASRAPLRLVYYAEIDADLNLHTLVKGLLSSGARSVWFGESGVGKTFIVIDLAIHIAAGRPWFGHKTTRGVVIYVAGEAAMTVRNRVAAFKKRNPDLAALPFAIIPEAIDARSAQADTDLLIEACRQAAEEFGLPVVLIVIDTLSRALAGGNESASEDMGALVMNIDRVCEATGAHVLLVHHSGKDAAKGARGHSLLRAAVDSEIEIIRPEGSDTSTLRVSKQRDLSPDIKPISFRLVRVELGTDQDGDAVASMIVEPAEASARPKGKPPSLKAKKFYDALLDALAAASAIRDESAGRPSVTKAQWKAECVRLGLVDAAEPENRQRALLSKYRLELVSGEWIACNGDFIWSTRGAVA